MVISVFGLSHMNTTSFYWLVFLRLCTFPIYFYATNLATKLKTDLGRKKVALNLEEKNSNGDDMYIEYIKNNIYILHSVKVNNQDILRVPRKFNQDSTKTSCEKCNSEAFGENHDPANLVRRSAN